MRSLLPPLTLMVAVAALAPACSGSSNDASAPGTTDAGGDALSQSDAASDAASDAGHDAGADAVGDAASDTASDAGDEADAASDATADTDSGGACTAETIDTTLTAAEHTALKGVVDAFQAANAGVSVTLDGAAEAVVGIDGEVPLALDANVSDPCVRAFAGLQAFFAQNAALFRLPPDLAVRVCSYDSILDADILRLGGGTYYGGRSLVGAPTELLVHVRRDGHIRYFVGNYLPVPTQPAITPCLDAAAAASAAVGTSLEYSRFLACQPKGPGSITLLPDDDYVPLETAVFVDAASQLHFVRLVDAFLAPSHVTNDTGNSDLYCCGTPSNSHCVGKTLVVDERTGEILAQLERCHTC